jgi:Tol biopolymer transport system component
LLLVSLAVLDAGDAPALHQVSQLATLGADGSDLRIVYETSDHIEAPNWTADGKWFVFNAKGLLWRIPADGSAAPVQIATGEVKDANNDHVLSPDGSTLYFSAAGQLYAVPMMEGGQPRRISNDQASERKFKYFLHGVTPDNTVLAYVGVEAVGGNAWGLSNLYTIPAAGGPDTQLTHLKVHVDGPEYSADGKWIYFNSELNAQAAGHSQCFRMTCDGGGIEQLTHDERVNWFPHISPDGKWVVFISFPPGTLNHPADKDVILRRMRSDGVEQADLLRFNGGQGTINVNSWAPDSKRFAFVMYADPSAAKTPKP